MVLAVALFGAGPLGTALSAATFLSGVFVAGAGLLTYQGGCFAVADALAADGPPQRGGLLPRLLSPRGGLADLLARRVDPAVSRAVRSLVHPGLFWVPQRTRAMLPFRTSMLARLPWRVVTGALALATGTAAGALLRPREPALGARRRGDRRARRAAGIGDRAAHRTAPGLISRGSCGCP